MQWHETVFNGQYDLFTFHFFSKDRNRHDALFLSSALQLGPGQKVLDTACGYGRHAEYITQFNCKVTGIDKTERYIKMARNKVQSHQASFHVMDMRQLEYENEFDAAYNFFTSFGYYDDVTNFDILRRISRSLKPGGFFLLDLQNRELFIEDGGSDQEHSEFEYQGHQCTLVMDTYLNLEESRAYIDQKVFGLPDGPRKMSFDVRVYTAAEIRWLFSQVGMEVVKFFGDTDSSPYEMDSQRCIALAQKL